MTNIQENLGPEPNKEDFTLVSDPSVRNKINAQLEYITARDFLTPYVGLEAVRKILAYSNIFVPNTVFLEKTSGYDIFDADQFGEKMGMTNDGEVVTAPSSPFKVYFEWKLNDGGEYDIFCSIVTDDELEELLADTEEEDEDEEEEMNEENKDVLSGGLKRTDLGLSDKLNKKGKLSKHTQKWMKTLAHGSGSLYSRSLGKPKGILPEEKKPPFEGPYSKTVAPKTEKKKHNEVAKLARRAIKKVKKKLEEDWDSNAATWSKKFADNARFAKSQSKAKHLYAEINPNYKKEKEKEAKSYTKKSKAAAKKAVTGMDEDYDHVRKAEARDAGAIAKRARNPKEKKFWKKAHKDLSKDAVHGRIDEVSMSKKTYINAMQRTTGYDAGSDEGRIDTDKLIARAKKYKGEKFANQLAGADQMTERPNRNKVPGQWGNDQLAWRTPAKATASGKANKSVLKGLKASLTKGDYRKPDFPKRNLPEEQQLNELHGKSREAIKAIKARLEKKHDDEWEATKEKRKEKKSSGPNDTRDEDKSRNNLAKRWLRADKAEKKLKEENINEISVGKAEKAYQVAKNKLLDNDIMVGMTKGPPKMKWIKRSNKRHNQAVKFANYAAKKKYEDSKTK